MSSRARRLTRFDEHRSLTPDAWRLVPGGSGGAGASLEHDGGNEQRGRDVVVPYRVSEAVPLAVLGLAPAVPTERAREGAPSPAALAAAAADQSSRLGQADTLLPALAAAAAAHAASIAPIPGLVAGPDAEVPASMVNADGSDASTQIVVEPGGAPHWSQLVDALAGGSPVPTWGGSGDQPSSFGTPVSGDAGAETAEDATDQSAPSGKAEPRRLRDVLAERGFVGPGGARLPREPLLALDLTRRVGRGGDAQGAQPPPLPSPVDVTPQLAAPAFPASGEIRPGPGEDGSVVGPEAGDVEVRARHAEAVARGPVLRRPGQVPVPPARYPLPATLPAPSRPSGRGQAWLGFLTGLVIAAAVGAGLYVYIVGL